MIYTDEDQEILLDKFKAIKNSKEQFTLRCNLLLSNLEDALIALLFNPNIQACVIRSGIEYISTNEFIRNFIFYWWASSH